MKLSEAIRLGAMLRPQAYNSAAIDGSCAMRAAADAVGIQDLVDDAGELLNYTALYERFPILYQSDHGRPIMSAIWCFNDSYRWTREQIADWVETIEQCEAQPAPTPEAVAV